MAGNVLKIAISVFLCSISISSGAVTTPDSRGVNWDTVDHKIDTYQWAQNVHKQMVDNVNSTQKLFPEPPLGETGWWHEYYCEDDAVRLTFDPKKATKHKCPNCGRIYTGKPYDDVWRSAVHSKIASAICDSAALYRITGEEKYTTYPKHILLWYANNYNKFKSHGKHAGKGWIREQSLDEATNLVAMATAFWDISPTLNDDERNIIAQQLLIPDAIFIQKQTKSIHNINSWHNCAVGLTALATGNQELLEKAINGKFGLVQQIEKGIKDDGFWYEGSISYHFYTISSIEPLYIAAQAAGILPDEAQKFNLMYSALLDFSFDNGEFPANNDGWPGSKIQKQIPFYETAAYLWPEIYSQTLANLYNNSSSTRNSRQALFYGPEILPKSNNVTRTSRLFADSGIAILRAGNINACLKYGPYGGGHDHRDRLNLTVFANGQVIIPDLGTSGYGISLTKWYRSPAAHNMLLVDGKAQAPCGGYFIDWSNNNISAGVNKAYSNTDIKRNVTISTNELSDIVSAQSNEKHTYDLIYHIRGEVVNTNGTSDPIANKLSGNGYEYFNDSKQVKYNGYLEITYKIHNSNTILTLTCRSDKSFEVYTATCPDNPANKTLSVLILRATGTNHNWNNTLTINNE